MTRFVGTPLRGIEFSSPSDEAVSARVNGDGHPRIRIDAGGRITWSAGASAGDTNLYRDGENTLVTDDAFKAISGLITLTSDGEPTSALPNGALAIDTTNHVFYFRSNNLWNQVSGGGGGASIEIGDTPPAEPAEGDLWYESDTGSMFVYYDSAWIETGGASDGGASTLDALLDVVVTSPTNGQVLKYNGTQWVNGTDDAGTTINSIDDIGDVTAPTPSSGDFLKWNGSAWVNDSIDLGTDTTGNYVSDITAGTGVTVTHTPSEGSSPTIAIGQAVGTTNSPTFAGITADNIQVGITGTNEIDTVSGDLTIDSAGGTVTVDDNLVVSGDLTVNGTTTTLNTETLAIEDNIIVLNSGVTASPILNAGIEVERGTSTNTALRWNETSDKWELTNDGTNYDAIQTATPFNALEQKVKNQMIYLLCEVGP